MLCLGLLCFLVVWSHESDQQQRHSHPKFLQQQNRGLDTTTNSSSLFRAAPTVSVSEIGISVEEWTRIQQTVFWDGPDQPVTALSMSTSPVHSTFSIQNLRKSYRIGDEIFVTVIARDFKSNTKRYGGDFFQAKLFSSKQKASVFGEVVDHRNGSYSVRFLLPWVGQAKVAVRLIHSSEAVQVLKRHRDTDSDRVYFRGYFKGFDVNGTKLSEVVECNVKWEHNGLERLGGGNCCCDYRDAQTGEVWRCQKPRFLTCNNLVYHSMGGYRNRLTGFERKLMGKKLTNRGIRGDSRVITVLPTNTSIGVTTKCHPGVSTPVPAGFYLKNVWTSLVCSTHHFNNTEAKQCLRDRHIYIMGDSTSRQWFDYLRTAVPTLKSVNLHSQMQAGPLMAVDLDNNIDLHWRAHGPPLRSRKSPVADLHYISNEIDGLAGGPRMVIVFNVGPHFTTYPLAFFTRRVARIRAAVLALLTRAPDTTVIIKTVNTGYKDVFGSDWYALQLDRILREIFQGVPVFILDVWQMTACHYNKENIHPAPLIIKNEMDIFLSFLCPV
ncbi:NXPE family member 3 [Chanos chanos]|uniref:NXPE family member 3 n=1 Tax=Chanos chanos TaxID=29144 RepID=A0A6J2W0T3_CHACN|nr:NXPE family member 3-like [Chanos chanos]